MLSFLLAENILSVVVLGGFFTSHLLMSLKNNMLEPIACIVFPDHFFDQGNLDKHVKWKLFLKDLVMWIIMMYIFYLIWTKILKKSPH